MICLTLFRAISKGVSYKFLGLIYFLCFFLQSILVRWEAPPEDSQNGIITGYKIRYRVAKDKTNLNVVTVDGTQILHSLLGEKQKNVFKSSSSSV